MVLTGVYGVGKSSLVEEMAGLFERDVGSYAAIDVDWLWWFAAPGVGPQASRQVLFANLKSVAGNYLDAVRHRQQSVDIIPSNRRGMVLNRAPSLAVLYAWGGDLKRLYLIADSAEDRLGA